MTRIIPEIDFEELGRCVGHPERDNPHGEAFV